MGNANQTLAWLALSAVAAGLPIAAVAAEKPAPAPPKQAANAPDAQGNPDAQGQEGAPAAKKKDPAAAERSYAAGVKAFEAGKMAEAVQSLSAALANGGLPAPQMAKALYYRGAAYRKQEKPAQAISDLTTAVWLKGGLSDADKAQAIEQRQMAYREAGLGDTAPPIGTAPLDAPASPAAKPVGQYDGRRRPGPVVVLEQRSSRRARRSKSAPPAAPQATPAAAPSAAPLRPAAETPAWQTNTPQQQASAEPPPVASRRACSGRLLSPSLYRRRSLPRSRRLRRRLPHLSRPLPAWPRPQASKRPPLRRVPFPERALRPRKARIRLPA